MGSKLVVYKNLQKIWEDGRVVFEGTHDLMGSLSGGHPAIRPSDAHNSQLW